MGKAIKSYEPMGEGPSMMKSVCKRKEGGSALLISTLDFVAVR